jgi:hypothetical protein
MPRIPRSHRDGKVRTRNIAIPADCVSVELFSCAASSNRSLGRLESWCRHACRICALLLAKELRAHEATS